MNVTLFVPDNCRVDVAALFLTVWGRRLPKGTAARPIASYEVEFLQRVRTTVRDVRDEQHRSVELRATAARLIASATVASASLASPSARAYRACVECRLDEAVDARTTTS